MEHGMNCPHHADKDEACTCALTERTMHAAWRKRAEEAETRIADLESQVKALTEERDRAIAYTFNADKHVELARTALHEMTAERDAQAEAVRVLAAEVNAAWNWNDADMYDRPDTWEHATSDAVHANPIARAAMEGGAG